MTYLTFIIAVVALIVAISAYRRTGGELDMKKQMETLSQVTDNLREKTADLLAKMEMVLRKKEDKNDIDKSASG